MKKAPVSINILAAVEIIRTPRRFRAAAVRFTAAPRISAYDEASVHA
jgi:hypothetical protein